MAELGSIRKKHTAGNIQNQRINKDKLDPHRVTVKVVWESGSLWFNVYK